MSDTEKQDQSLEAVVIIHTARAGDSPDIYVVGSENIRVFCIDEMVPNDRVYEWLSRDDPSIIRELIPEGETIGSKLDERHKAIKHRILSLIDGKSHLAPVEDE